MLLTVALVSCKKEKNDTACPKGSPDPNCVCPTYYAPVCGCDKVTYDNVCSAACAGITTYTNGKCP